MDTLSPSAAERQVPAPSSGSLPPYWSRPLDDLFAELGSSPSGLSEARAAAILQSAGPNSIEERAEGRALALLLRQFANPLVLILLFGAGISLFLREWIDAAIIVAIVAGSALLSFYQEYRASAAVAELRRRLKLTARVVRGGVEAAIPVDRIVPGDIVLLAAGNLVPGDGRIIEANDCLVSEAALTGESFPVEKKPGLTDPEAPVTARTNAVFMGTSVRSGTARILIVETGIRTAYGRIAARLRAREPETDFARGVRLFGAMLLRVMIVIVLAVLTVNQLLDRPVAESLLFAVALAVGLSPELLPAIVSVTLSAGARDLSRSGVIVRRLEAIENLGSLDILCTDKTGTLTEGKVSLESALDPAGLPSEAVRLSAWLNASLQTGMGNPLDAALIADAEASGRAVPAASKLGEIPYDFARRRLTLVLADGQAPDGCRLITKGAFAEVLAICSAVARDGGAVPLDEESRQRLEKLFRENGEAGFRVLAIAERGMARQSAYGPSDETGMTFTGLLLFSDPSKADVRKTIAELRALGIGVKIISGDNRYVTAHLASSVGLPAARVLTGGAIQKMGRLALTRAVSEADILVEIDPQQKERIVRALQRNGHSVGFLGDGINDAPALKAADVGISVDQAVDVARETADVVLLRPDLEILRQGVLDGRRTFANTIKYIGITISGNFGNMVSMALATPLLPFLPLLPKQILLNNFLSSLPSAAISTDNVDADRLASPQRWDVRAIRRYMILFGLTSSLFDLLTFAVLLLLYRAKESEFQTAWFVVSLMTELAVVLVLRTRNRPWKSRPSRLLLWSISAMLLATLSAPYLGGTSALFGLIPLPLPLIGLSLLIVLLYVAATEAAKRIYYRRDGRAGSAAR